MDISEGDEVCISYLAEEPRRELEECCAFVFGYSQIFQSRQDVLMFSASHRKRALKKTKLFLCTCERCLELRFSKRAQPVEFFRTTSYEFSGCCLGDERAASGTDPVDLCRGFRCPHCITAASRAATELLMLSGSRERESPGARWEPYFPAVERGRPCRGWPPLQLPFS